MKTNLLNPYFQISEQNVIFQGNVSGHEYIVYFINQSVHVNTDYQIIAKGMYRCCVYYDRKLCDTILEFKKMSKKKIESQAYNSWMDGAHS